MNKKLNKKGFTIVELVIVIVVIAILAAVLIPTFVSLVKKANLSADQQAVRQMNTVLATETEVDTFGEAINALEVAGYNAADRLVPVTKNHAFYWYKNYNIVVLVNEEDAANKVLIYPDDEKYAETFAADIVKTGDEQVLFDLDGGIKYIDVTTDDAKALADAITIGSEKITLSGDVAFDKTVTIPKDANVNLDLNGYDFTTSTGVGRPIEVAEGATITINADESTVTNGKYGFINVPSTTNNATIVVNGGNYVGNLYKGAFIKIRENSNPDAVINIVLNDVNYSDDADTSYLINSSGFVGTVKLTVNGGKYNSGFGFTADVIEAKDVKITTEGFAFYAYESAVIDSCVITTANINDSVLGAGGSAPAAAVAISGNGMAEVKNCTIITSAPAYYVYSTGGTITANNNDVTCTNEKLYSGSADHATAKGAYITIDGENVLNITK